jgi:hypothetical protein
MLPQIRESMNLEASLGLLGWDQEADAMFPLHEVVLVYNFLRVKRIQESRSRDIGYSRQPLVNFSSKKLD